MQLRGIILKTSLTSPLISPLNNFGTINFKNYVPKRVGKNQTTKSENQKFLRLIKLYQSFRGKFYEFQNTNSISSRPSSLVH